MAGGIVCAGSWSVDIVHALDRWPGQGEMAEIGHEAEGIGGSAANVMLALEAFGVDVPLFAMGLIGQDRHGETCLAGLEGSAAELRWLKRTDRAMTAHAHVMTVPGESRTIFYHPGACDLLGEGDLPVEQAAMAGAGLFFLGCPNLLGALGGLGPDGATGAARVLARARAAGMVTCVELAPKPGLHYEEVVGSLLPVTDYLFCDEREAAMATGVGIEGPRDRKGIARAATVLKEGGVRRAVVIHTPALAHWQGSEALVVKTEPPERVVSRLGAGDAFCAGTIWGLYEGWTAEQALTLGHRAAVAAMAGEMATGTIPRLEELL